MKDLKDLKDLKDSRLVTQLVVVATTMPKLKQFIDDLLAENEKLKTALTGWEIGFDRMGYERLLKDQADEIKRLNQSQTYDPKKHGAEE